MRGMELGRLGLALHTLHVEMGEHRNLRQAPVWCKWTIAEQR